MRQHFTMGNTTLECDPANEAIDSNNLFHIKVENEWNHLQYTNDKGVERKLSFTISMSSYDAQCLYRMLALALDTINRKPSG